MSLQRNGIPLAAVRERIFDEVLYYPAWRLMVCHGRQSGITCRAEISRPKRHLSPKVDPGLRGCRALHVDDVPDHLSDRDRMPRQLDGPRFQPSKFCERFSHSIEFFGGQADAMGKLLLLSRQTSAQRFSKS